MGEHFSLRKRVLEGLTVIVSVATEAWVRLAKVRLGRTEAVHGVIRARGAPGYLLGRALGSRVVTGELLHGTETATVLLERVV